MTRDGDAGSEALGTVVRWSGEQVADAIWGAKKADVEQILDSLTSSWYHPLRRKPRSRLMTYPSSRPSLRLCRSHPQCRPHLLRPLHRGSPRHPACFRPRSGRTRWERR